MPPFDLAYAPAFLVRLGGGEGKGERQDEGEKGGATHGFLLGCAGVMPVAARRFKAL
jgi:hypothetical protein